MESGDTYGVNIKLTQMSLVACKMLPKQTGQKGLPLLWVPQLGVLIT